MRVGGQAVGRGAAWPWPLPGLPSPPLPDMPFRRCPPQVHVHSLDRFGSLAALTRVLQASGLTITRAKVVERARRAAVL